MEITQSDRDNLRAAQQKLNPMMVIGNIVEHKTRSPKKYKQELSTSSVTLKGQLYRESGQMPRRRYESKYLNTRDTSAPIEGATKLDLPIDLSEVNKNSWLNMNQVEFDKLEWMSNEEHKTHQEQLKATALFDSHGRTLGVSSNKIESGEHDEGHDIESLINLIDSTYPPQVTYALGKISKIASLTTLGYYDGAFDTNIHDILIDKFLLRARHHLDSPNESIRQNALKCMRALLCNTQFDEVTLDRIHPLVSDNPNPNLWLQTSEMRDQKFTIEMSDNECIKVDAIRALIERTDILKKFRYLLDVHVERTSLIYHECTLDILIRIARHSPDVCSALTTPDLLNRLIELFLPQALTAENELIRPLSIKALKLIRIIAQGTRELMIDSSKASSKELIESRIPDRIVPVIEAYFFIDCYNSSIDQSDNLGKLHIETLRLIKALSKLKKFRGNMTSVLAMGQERLFASLRSLDRLRATKKFSSAISFDWQYAAHLIDLMGFASGIDRYQEIETFKYKMWCDYITPVLLRWIADVISMKIIPHLDVSVTISTGVNHYKNRITDRGKKALIDVLIQPIVEESKNPSQMNLFKLLVRSATEKSQLPNFSEENGKLRDPKGLPSFGCLNYNTSSDFKFKSNPVVEDESPFILLGMFINNLKADMSGTMPMLSIFVDSIYLSRYIRCATGYHKRGPEYESLVKQSIVAQFEIQTICRSILLLGQYYLNYNDVDNMDMTNNFKIFKEPQEFKEKRIECYGNLVYYSISAIGLLNMSAQSTKDSARQLFENVLLNNELHRRVAVESFEKEPKLDSRKYDQRNFAEGGFFDKCMTDELMIVLAPLYTSLEQMDRFWIFQPLIDCYRIQIGEDTQVEGKNQGNCWFKHPTGDYNTPDRIVTKINHVLLFNCSMLYCSPAYEHLIIRPNIEDYICIVGSLFLDDNLFLNEELSKSMCMNLRALLTGTEETGKLDGPFKDASKIIKPLNLPAADFFDKLTDQFESASYGDPVFSNFLLLFITPRSDKMFRKKLFQEKGDTCLRILRIASTSVWLPTEIFFDVKEEDPEIRTLLRSSQNIVVGSFMDDYRRFHCS